MKINVTYELTREHLFEFQRVYNRHSKEVRKYKRIMFFGVVIVLLAIHVADFLNPKIGTFKPNWSWIIPLAFIYGYFVSPWGLNRQSVKRVKKLYADGSGDASFGRINLEISDAEVKCAAPDASSTFQWASIKKAVVSDKIIALFVGPLNAVIVPKVSLDESTIQNIVSILESKHQSRSLVLIDETKI